MARIFSCLANAAAFASAGIVAVATYPCPLVVIALLSSVDMWLERGEGPPLVV